MAVHHEVPTRVEFKEKAERFLSSVKISNTGKLENLHPMAQQAILHWIMLHVGFYLDYAWRYEEYAEEFRARSNRNELIEERAKQRELERSRDHLSAGEHPGDEHEPSSSEPRYPEGC